MVRKARLELGWVTGRLGMARMARSRSRRGHVGLELVDISLGGDELGRARPA